MNPKSSGLNVTVDVKTDENNSTRETLILNLTVHLTSTVKISKLILVVTSVQRINFLTQLYQLLEH